MQPSNSLFWQHISTLVESSTVVIDRPRGSAHPRYPDRIYPLDYGYLDGTLTVDGGGMDCWRGTASPETISGVLCTVDLVKRDVEIKVLLGCTPAEIQTILEFHTGDVSSAMLIHPPAAFS